MTQRSARQFGAIRTSLLAGALVIATAQGWSQNLIGDLLAPSDDPDSRYSHSQVMPPSWQGRPYAIPGIGE